MDGYRRVMFGYVQRVLPVTAPAELMAGARAGKQLEQELCVAFVVSIGPRLVTEPKQYKAADAVS